MEYNGRIIDLDAKQEQSYRMFNETPSKNARHFKTEAIKGHFTENPLSDIFFSQTNVNALQDGIRFMVWKKTDGTHIIDRQSDVELQVVMRSIYLTHSKNVPFDILGQVKALNSMVLDWVVPRIVQEISLFQKYKRDISTLPVPLERSKNMSSSGTKFLFNDKL